MKVAVTGAAGYLGRVLLPMLEAEDSIDNIVAIDLAPPPAAKKMTFAKRDVRDPAIVRDFEGCDALVHLAFIVMPIRSEKETDSINIDGSKNVMTQAAAAGVRKIVHLSSVAAYGAWPDNPSPIYEHSPLRPMPQFYYSRTKGAVEKWLDPFENGHPDISLVRLRPCIFVGPKINNAMTTVAKTKIVPAYRGYNPATQYVWDEDVAQAIILALMKNVRGAYNIAGDNPIDMAKTAEIVGARVVSIPYTLARLGARVAWAMRLSKYINQGWVEASRYPTIVNCDKARNELGWKPSLDSAGALERFIKEMRK